MTVYRNDLQTVHAGSFDTRTPERRALDAIGDKVPALEQCLGFALSVTATAKPDGFIWVEVLVPDEHYGLNTCRRIGQALRNAAQPFTERVYIETDSATPYEQ